MATLTMTITNSTIPDYDGVNENVRVVEGDIDGTKLKERVSCIGTANDADCKTSFKNRATALGYTWDTEI